MSNIQQRISSLTPQQKKLLELRLKQKQGNVINKRKASDILAVSLMQERLWIFNQLQPEMPLYNESRLFKITGLLNHQALEKSINEIIKRHEILRTDFKFLHEQLIQSIHSEVNIFLPIIDLKHFEKNVQENQLKEIVASHSSLPFNLQELPLLRGVLISLNEQEQIMLLVMHHIISDGWSWKVFSQELATFYSHFCHNTPINLPELSIQYADYALWHRQYIKEKVQSHQLDYWKQQLKTAPPLLELPTDVSRPAIQTFRGAREIFEISPQLSHELRKLSNCEGVTLFMLLLAAFKTLLFRYTGQTDLLVGTPVANRTQIETENLLGCFINTIVLRSNFVNNLSFRELLKQIKETTLAAYNHQDLPFDELVKELKPERSPSYTPIFQVMFVFQETPILALQLPDLTITPLSIDNGIAKLDLTLYIEDNQNNLVGFFEYNTDIFSQETIIRMSYNWQTLVESIVSKPAEKIAKLSLLSRGEQQKLVREWNNTETNNQCDRCLHNLFEEQVNQTPLATAVTFGETSLTYLELNKKANQLAHYLEKQGVKIDDLVGICLERSLEMVITLLAILKVGAAYVPLDPTYPSERLNFILEDTKIQIILTQKYLSQSLVVEKIKIINLDIDQEIINQQAETNPLNNCNPESLAYIIYTSGSTGNPKGVMNTHVGVCNRLLWMQSAYNLKTTDVVLQKTPFSFDVSVWEFFWALITGGSIVLAEPEGHKDSAYLVKLIQKHEINIIHFVPSMLQVFLEEPEVKQCQSLKKVICSGEPLTYCLQQRFFNTLSCELHNLYGPTEAAIDVTFWQCQPESELKIVPIGRPISNIQIYILDSYLQPVPIGVHGELHIGGVGVARGYLNRPELTREKFINNPFGEGFLYKSGDLARYLTDGNIEYLGRLDHQIKLRGFRIELGEIESTILRHPKVREAVVIVKENSEQQKYLVAYIVTHQEIPIYSEELNNFLIERLPKYMIPSGFVCIESLPLTSNGKVDRRALSALKEIDLPRQSNYQVPKTPIEEILVGIWAQLLNVEKIGIYDNFFALGGHSLLATQVISRLRKIFQIEIPLNQLFEAPTIAEFAQRLEKFIKLESKVSDLPIEKVSRKDVLPLSFAQQRLWFLQQLEPESAAYNGSNTLLIEGKLNFTALEQSINEIIKRHEVLRTSFLVEEGQPIQKIVSELKIPLNIINLEHLSTTAREAEVKARATINSLQPFDLTQAPLLRLNLLCLEREQHILLVTMHHIISDAWSGGIFIRELSTLYEAFSLNNPSPMTELPIQYADFAIWQKQWLQGQILEQQLSYWQQQLKGANTVLALPCDQPRTQHTSAAGARYPFQLSADLCEKLEILSQQEGVTLFMTLLAAYNTLLYYYTKQTDLLVGSPIANRNHSELEELIGFFINTLVLRTDMSNNPSFGDLLQRVRKVALEAYTHQDIPFEKLVAQIQPERHLDRHPFFQVWFVFQNAPTSEWKISGLNLSLLDLETPMVRHDLKLDISKHSSQLQGFFEYKTDLFTSDFMNQLFQHWLKILDKIVENHLVTLNEIIQVLATQEQEAQNLNNEKLKENNRQKLGKIKRKALGDNHEI